MNIKRIKKVVALLVILCFSIWILNIEKVNVFAYGENEKNANVNEVLTELVQLFYPEIEPEIEDITPIYDDDWNIIEYALDITYNNIDYGYAIFEGGTLDIIEFKIEKGIGTFWTINFQIDKQDNNVIKKVDALQYELFECEDAGVNYLGNKDDLFDIFLEEIPVSIYHNYYVKEKYIPKRCAFGETYVTNKLGMEYCCAVTAMLNVCGEKNFFDANDINSTAWAYGTLWSMIQVKKISGEYVANQEDMGAVVSQFAKWYAGKDVPYRRKENPKMSFFIDAVDKKYSSILGVTSYYTEEDESGNKVKKMGGRIN